MTVHPVGWLHHKFTVDIDEFCPSPYQATIDKTWQVKPCKPTFQVSNQSEFVCSKYNRCKMRTWPWVRIHSQKHVFESISQAYVRINRPLFISFGSNPSSSQPQALVRIGQDVRLRIHQGSLARIHQIKALRIDETKVIRNASNPWSHYTSNPSGWDGFVSIYRYRPRSIRTHLASNPFPRIRQVEAAENVESTQLIRSKERVDPGNAHHVITWARDAIDST